MEPQTPQAPQPEPTQNPQLGDKKKLTKKQWLIVIISIVVVVLIVIIKLIMSHSTGGGSGSNDKLDPSIYHAREGYDAQQLGAAIGDPLALDMSKHSAPLMTAQGSPSSVSNNPIVYACNILSINDLHEQKAYLQGRADTKAVVRGFLDRTGKAGVDKYQYTLPGSVSPDDNNVCQYDLQTDILNIAVYQPPYALKAAIDDALARRYQKTDSIAGLDTYKEKDNTSSSGYMMVTGQSAIEFLFNGTDTSVDMQKKLLSIAAKNFIEQEKHPVGPSIPQFKSPTYTQKYARACDYISNDDIKSLTGSDASVYTTESLPSGTGVAKVSGKLYNSVSTECARYNTGLGTPLTAGPFNQKLDVTITSFNADAPAKEYMANSRKSYPGQAASSIGDEGYGYRESEQNALAFRQGRFIVEIVFDLSAQKEAGLEDTAVMTQKLTPYAHQLAEKLKSIQ